MARSTKEWIGKTDDTPIPPRVKLRVRSRANNTCQNCGVRADRGDADHTIALILGGENRESNLQWLCVNCHRAKTATDLALKSGAAKTQKRVAGVKPKTSWSKYYHAMKKKGWNPWTRKPTP